MTEKLQYSTGTWQRKTNPLCVKIGQIFLFCRRDYTYCSSVISNIYRYFGITNKSEMRLPRLASMISGEKYVLQQDFSAVFDVDISI